jgi:DNA-binding MarR family transcriptional regulator
MNATNDLQGIEEIQTAIDELKKRAMILDSSSSVSRKLAPKKATPAKPKSKNSAAKKTAAKKTAAKKTAAKKTAAKKPAAKKPIAKKPAAKKPAAKKPIAKKPTAAKKPAAKKTAAKKTAAKKSDSKKSEKTPEEEMEASLSDKEIENFRIEKVDMDKLTNKVCVILAEYESNGMLQNELWKKLKLSNRDGSRLSLKLERMGTITREKILQKNRWTYKLILKKTPISTKSIENAPCLVCPVEQRCTLDGEISPKNCQLIEDWVINSMKKPKSR